MPLETGNFVPNLGRGLVADNTLQSRKHGISTDQPSSLSATQPITEMSFTCGGDRDLSTEHEEYGDKLREGSSTSGDMINRNISSSSLIGGASVSEILMTKGCTPSINASLSLNPSSNITTLNALIPETSSGARPISRFVEILETHDLPKHSRPVVNLLPKAATCFDQQNSQLSLPSTPGSRTQSIPINASPQTSSSQQQTAQFEHSPISSPRLVIILVNQDGKPDLLNKLPASYLERTVSEFFALYSEKTSLPLDEIRSLTFAFALGDKNITTVPRDDEEKWENLTQTARCLLLWQSTKQGTRREIEVLVGVTDGAGGQ